MEIHKITTGYVIQKWKEGKYLGAEFIGGEEEYEDEIGESIDPEVAEAVVGYEPINIIVT